jgi:hypothetical protein
MLIRSIVMMAAATSLGLIAKSSERADPSGSGGQTQNAFCDIAAANGARESDRASLLCSDGRRSMDAGPRSTRRSKEGVAYVSPATADELGQAALDIRLATFRYKGGDGSRHLGFIIEDNPAIFASDSKNGRVDLYGYISMAVAALQSQARHIEQVEAEIDVLSNEVEALRGKPHGSLSSTCDGLMRPIVVAR